VIERLPGQMRTRDREQDLLRRFTTPRRGEVDQYAVMARRCEQLDPERQPVAPVRPREGDGAQIQQVHHVGEAPEPAVHTNRIRSDFRQRRMLRRHR
jgi:hypothetical protein